MDPIKDVGIVVFNGVERLDFEGPMGVLAWTRVVTGDPITIRLLSKDGQSIRDHLLKRTIEVDGATTEQRDYDLIIVPGGDPPQFVGDQGLVDEIGRLARAAKILASVCTGALLVAKTGLADGKTMTTHWDFVDLLRRQFPAVTVAAGHRYYQDGSLWSSAGISAGIDMMLRFVAATWGDAVAKKVQGVLEYFPEPPYTRDEVIAARKMP
jgi:transcriptional regulator GlxA family with amidase domain